jgi:hypothetical protein
MYWLSSPVRTAAHQLLRDKHQDMRQKRQTWRQHHNSDRRAAVFIISFVSNVLLSLRHVADIVSWLLYVLTHAGVRPALSKHVITVQWLWYEAYHAADFHRFAEKQRVRWDRNISNWYPYSKYTYFVSRLSDKKSSSYLRYRLRLL